MEPPPLSPVICSFPRLTDALAEAFLAGPWDLEPLVNRAATLLGRRYRWVRPVATHLLATFGGGTRPRRKRLARFLADDPRIQRAYLKHQPVLHLDRFHAPLMLPAPGPPQSWTVPQLPTINQLAHFLELDTTQLQWFADTQFRERKLAVEPLRHYRYHWIPKPSGAHRLIEIPKPRLKAIQRKLLDAILSQIPAHKAAHGFRAGHSTLSFAQPHVGCTVVLKMDLRDFFVSVRENRIIPIYLTAGYPEPVARCLAGLSTNAVPQSVLRTSGPPSGTSFNSVAAQWRNHRAYTAPHLPQGSPSSPALANLVAYRLDARLAGLAARAQATYTRYADDLLFSGDARFARNVHRFAATVASIAIEQGFAIQPHKTRIMSQGTRQRVAGIVINQRINLCRDDFDTLKATLTNAIRSGPQSQNRSGVADFRAHLAGRIAYAKQLNPVRGRKLAELFEQIDWDTNENP